MTPFEELELFLRENPDMIAYQLKLDRYLMEHASNDAERLKLIGLMVADKVNELWIELELLNLKLKGL